MVIDLEWCTDLLDPPAVQHHQSVGECHRLELVVGDVDGGDAKAALQALNLAAHGDAKLGIKVGERLVEQEGGGLADNCTTHGDTLALATGKRTRLAVEVRVDLQHARSLGDTRIDIGARRVAVPQTVFQVPPHRHVRVERVVLEDHGDVALRRLAVVHDSVGNCNGAFGDRFETRHHAQQRGLPAAGRPDEDDELPVGDIETDAAHGTRAARIHLADVLDLDGRHSYFSVSTRPLTNRRCMQMTMRTGGSMAIITAAMAKCHSGSASALADSRLMPMTMV